MSKEDEKKLFERFCKAADQGKWYGKRHVEDRLVEEKGYHSDRDDAV